MVMPGAVLVQTVPLGVGIVHHGLEGLRLAVIGALVQALDA